VIDVNSQPIAASIGDKKIMSQSLNCLLVQQPYASLIVFGQKRWEFRSYEVKRRGTIGIAASPSSVLSTRDAELNKVSQILPRGVVLGTAELVNCFYAIGRDLEKYAQQTVRVSLHGKDVVTLGAPIGEPQADVSEAIKNPNWSSFVWEFENIKPLEVPISIVKSSMSTWVRIDLNSR